jgi:hypothetical protein
MVTKTSTVIKVGKLDAARRQLRVAARMWFLDDDPVAIHTLAAAAHEIIHTIYRRRGFHGLLFDTHVIKEEFRSDWGKFLKEAASFFKHAQRDSDATFDFNPGRNVALLLACVHGLHKMGEPRELEDSAFMHWLRVQHPNWFLKTEAENSLTVDYFDKLRGIPKHQFFNAFQLRWREQHRGQLAIRLSPRRIARSRLPG